MEYIIQNKDLSVTISSHGAEMQSIKYKNKEYLWQGDSTFWSGHSPLLFPFVGRFTNGMYSFKGDPYYMDIHGFAKSSEFFVSNRDESSITFSMGDTPETLAMYPFHFMLKLIYTLQDNQILISYHIQNQSSETMYFGIGGHPGFQLPLDEGLSFQDYYLEFSREHIPTRVGHTPACFLSGKDNDFLLEDNKKLTLHHKLFHDDAIVLKNVADSVTLKSDKGTRSVTLSYPDFPYLGLWHAPKTQAPYVCIEPWTSLPSRQDIIEDLQFKSDLIRLKKDTVYQNEWKIIVN